MRVARERFLACHQGTTCHRHWRFASLSHFSYLKTFNITYVFYGAGQTPFFLILFRLLADRSRSLKTFNSAELRFPIGGALFNSRPVGYPESNVDKSNRNN